MSGSRKESFSAKVRKQNELLSNSAEKNGIYKSRTNGWSPLQRVPRKRTKRQMDLLSDSKLLKSSNLIDFKRPKISENPEEVVSKPKHLALIKSFSFGNFDVEPKDTKGQENEDLLNIELATEKRPAKSHQKVPLEKDTHTSLKATKDTKVELSGRMIDASTQVETKSIGTMSDVESGSPHMFKPVCV